MLHFFFTKFGSFYIETGLPILKSMIILQELTLSCQMSTATGMVEVITFPMEMETMKYQAQVWYPIIKVSTQKSKTDQLRQFSAKAICVDWSPHFQVNI